MKHINLILLLIVFFYPGLAFAKLDSSKWQTFPQTLEVNNGKLEFTIEGVELKATNRVRIVDNTTNYLSAKVLVRISSMVSKENLGVIRIGGVFYNDSLGPGSGKDYNGREGDTWAINLISLDGDNNLKAIVYVGRFAYANPIDTETIFRSEFSSKISFETEYTLSIEFTGSALVFKCNDEEITYTLSSPVYDPYDKQRELAVKVYDYGTEERSGYIQATFDDVYIDKNLPPYDNFE